MKKNTYILKNVWFYLILMSYYVVEMNVYLYNQMEVIMNQNQKTIRVMGTGFVKITPDATRLSFSIHSFLFLR